MSSKKKNKEEVKKKKKGHKKLKKVLLSLLLIMIVLFTIGAGVAVAVISGLVKGEWSLSNDDLSIEYQNSTILDLDGNEIGKLSGSENRIIVSMEDMSPYLKQAFISIEDERFETHKGVDLKRTVGAVLSFVTHKGSSSYGGSTITQQVIKNLTDERDDKGIKGAIRKVKEMSRAYQLEKMWSKDQIIELYMNLIPLGGDTYGVEMASRKYFNKSAKDLTVVEAAYLAGITNAPSTYNPFSSNAYGTDEAKTKRVNKRVTDVLYKMNQLGRLGDEEYKEALKVVEEGIKFEQGSTTSNTEFSYHTEEAIKQIKKDLMAKNNWTEKETELHIYGGGYTIYTTQDSSIQEEVEKAYANNKDWITKTKVTEKDADGKDVKVEKQMQSAMVIIDHSTGYVVGGAGALGEKSAWGLNRMTATQHQPGSSIKPIAVVGPSLQEGLITAASVVDDTPVSYPGGAKPYTPKNDTAGYFGLMNIRYILRVSRNIPEVKMMSKLTVAKSEEYLKQMGITSLSGKEGLALALGGADNGISPLEMAGAYATIANNGVYIEPTFYIKIVDKSGNTVLEKKQETHRVFSEQNAWLLQSLLVEPTGAGIAKEGTPTGSGAIFSKDYQICGKTGTTNKSTSTWFCGFTPYYTASMYFGYDSQEVGQRKAPGSGTVARRWAGIMKTIHKGLEAKKFEQPSGITTAKVCKKSGLLPTDLCSEAGCVYTEYFAEGTVPKEKCKTHVEATICKNTGLLAGEHCTSTERKIFITREDRENSTAWEKAADASQMVPTEYCTEENITPTPTPTPTTTPTVTPEEPNVTPTPSTTPTPTKEPEPTVTPTPATE